MFEGVHVHNYLTHDIISINALSTYAQSQLFYVILNPTTYKSGNTLFNALTDLSTEYKKSRKPWTLLNKHFHEENKLAPPSRLVQTVQNFIHALVISKEEHSHRSLDSPFRVVSDDDIDALLTSKEEDILNNRNLLSTISEALIVLDRDISCTRGDTTSDSTEHPAKKQRIKEEH